MDKYLTALIGGALAGAVYILLIKQSFPAEV